MRSISPFSSIVAVLILGFLGLLTLFDIFDGPGTEREERIAVTPELRNGLSAIVKFLSEARFYVGERYALKDTFVFANGIAKLAIFNHSPADNVALGQNGYLFLTTQGALEISQGRDQLKDAEESKWRDTFATMQATFRDIGANYAFLIGPNKHTIYPDMLPLWIVPVAMDRTRTHDIIGLAREVYGPSFVDSRLLLSDARAELGDVALYHPTDTHWTELGAALAVHEALTGMGLDLPPPTYEIEDLANSGDLARMIGQQRRWSASAPVLPRRWACRDTSGKHIEVATIDPLMPRRFICGSPDGQPTRLVVFHDSFGVSAIPYIAARFREVEFIWSNSANPAEAARLDAEYVLHIIAERRLITKTPDRLLLENGQ